MGNRVGWWIIDINAGVKDNTEDLNRAAVAGNYFQNLRGDIWHLVSMDLTSHIRRVTIEWLWVIVYQYFVISIIILQKHSLKKLSKDILFSLLSNTYTFHTHLLRYQLMNFKSRQEWGQMKAFSYRNCCSKRIFLKNHYFGQYMAFKNCPKNEKMHFSRQWAGIRKSFRIETPIIFQF